MTKIRKLYDTSLKCRGWKTITNSLKRRVSQEIRNDTYANDARGRQRVCYYNQILLSISQVIEFLRMCRGCWGLPALNHDVLKLDPWWPREAPRGPGRHTCRLGKVRPPLCSSTVKCSFLITELLSLRGSQSQREILFQSGWPRKLLSVFSL